MHPIPPSKEIFIIRTCWYIPQHFYKQPMLNCINGNPTYKNFHCGEVNLFCSFPFEFAQYGATVWFFSNILDTEVYLCSL